jgi:hypothetical protein
MTQASYWQPPGLSALQIQLAIILRHLDDAEYSDAIDAMKNIALITSELDIINQSEKFCKITDQQLRFINTALTLTEADKIAPYKKGQEYLKQRSYELLKLIMSLCNKHGITIKHPRDVASNSNRSSQLLGE